MGELFLCFSWFFVRFFSFVLFMEGREKKGEKRRAEKRRAVKRRAERRREDESIALAS